MPAAVRPVGGILNEAVMDRVVVDISNEPGKIFIGINKLALEVRFEQTAFAVVFFIVGLGIAIEKVRKLLANSLGKPSKGLEPLEDCS